MGGALHFDGVDDYVGVEYDLPRSESSVSLWIQTTTKDQGILAWSAAGHLFPSYTDRMFYVNASGRIGLYVYGGGACSTADNFLEGGPDIADGQYHHVVGVWGATGKQLYVDGVLVASNASGIAQTAAMPYLTIGWGVADSCHTPAHPFLNGTLDELRVYTRTLSAGEIGALYDAGLAGHWSFDEGQGTLAQDSSGHGRSGVLNNFSPSQSASSRVAGVSGLALHFDGVDDYVGVEYDLPRSDSRVSFWIQTTTKDQGILAWSAAGHLFPSYTDRMFYVNASGRIGLYVYGVGACSTPDNFLEGGPDIADGQYHHVVGVWGATGKQLYVDGVPVASNASGIAQTAAMPYLTIGWGVADSCHTPAHPFLNGTLDELQVWGNPAAVPPPPPVTAAPSFSLGSGSYPAAQLVAISAAAGSTIHYTLNGAEPTESDLVVGSGGTVLIGTNTTLKAKAWASGALPSETTTATYTISSATTSSGPVTLGNGNLMPPIPGGNGRTIPAQGPDGPLDQSSGHCTSEVLTTFVPPTQTLKAVFYFPWHFSPNEGTCEGILPGEICSKEYWPKCVTAAGLPGEKPGFQPALGFYSSDENVSPGITASHMATMAAAGVDVVAIEWTGIGKREETNSLPRVLNEAGSRGMKVALLYDLAIALNTTIINLDEQIRRERITDDFRHFRSQYFGRPEYLRIDGKPVVYLYISREISSPANPHGIQEFFNALRADPSIGDLYLVADHLKASGENLESLRQIGAQAVTAFHGADRRNNGISVRAMADALSQDYYVRKREELLALNTVNIFPGVFPQYDDQSVGNCGRDGSTPDKTTQNYNLTSVDDWKYMLSKVGTDQRWNVKKIQVKRDCSEVPLAGQVETPSIMWVYSFNEWAEGSGIEPLVEPLDGSPRYPWRFGSDLMNALRDHSFGSTSGEAGTLIPFSRGPNGMQETQRPNFVWDGVHGADQFQLEVKNSSQSVVFSHEQSDTILVPTENYEPGTYTWRVRARLAGSWAPWSPGKTFMVSEGGPVCNLDNECDEASGETHLTCPSDCTGGVGSCTVDGPATQSFVISPAVTYAGQPVTFSAAMSPITVGTMPLWDVGTGDHFAGSPTTYTYNFPGTYNVTLTSNDANCQTTVLTTQVINVVPPPAATCSELAALNGPGWTYECKTPAYPEDVLCDDVPGAPGSKYPAADCQSPQFCCLYPSNLPPPPPPPNTQSCGELGGEVCSQTSSCPAGYGSLGTTRQNGGLECQTCCNETIGDGYCEPNVEGCGTSPDCPCWMAGTTCSASGPSGQCVDRCSDPAFHNHSASCGEADECGHAIGSASECLPSCGGMGGDHCSETVNWCPGGYGYLGQSNDCQSCCQLDPCASFETHDHGGSCGSEDSCGHSFGSNEDCGCSGAPTVFDTCWGNVCDTDWLWVPQLCDTCEQQCTTETSCSTVCDEFGCWDECVPYESCSQVCTSHECGGYWAPFETNCRLEPYQCNPHQCGS
jgi:PKD repeat protein